MLSTLTRILNKEFIETAQNPGFYYLKEEKVPNFPQTLVRYNKFQQILICQFDKSDSNKLFPIFDIGQPNLSAICDYIIFYKKNEKLYAFLCNLKSTNAGNSSKQIGASQILSDYILNMAKRELNYTDTEIVFRALIFTKSFRTRFHTNIRQAEYTTIKNPNVHQLHFVAGKNCYLDLLCR